MRASNRRVLDAAARIDSQETRKVSYIVNQFQMRFPVVVAIDYVVTDISWLHEQVEPPLR